LTRGNARRLVNIEIRYGAGRLADIGVIGVVGVGCSSGNARMGLFGDEGTGAVGVGARWVLTWG
jgi:hypothetical protein